MKDAQTVPSGNQGDEKKEESKTSRIIRKISATIGFIFFLLILIGAIMKKCGG